jgi:hypothetical protein
LGVGGCSEGERDREEERGKERRKGLKETVEYENKAERETFRREGEKDKRG